MGRIVVFHGADHKCGVSQSALGVAEIIAELAPSQKILLLHAEGRLGLDYSIGAGLCIQDIQSYLRESAAAEEIKERARWRRNLHIIGGDFRPDSSEHYKPEDIGIFLKNMSEQVDLTICDSGADIGHPLALGSLIRADGVYIFLRQSEICMSRAEWLIPLYSELRLKICGYIICKYEVNSAYSLALASSRLGIEGDISVVHRSRFGKRAETEGRSLIGIGERRYRKGISRLAESIMASAGIQKEVGGWLRKDTASEKF